MEITPEQQTTGINFIDGLLDLGQDLNDAITASLDLMEEGKLDVEGPLFQALKRCAYSFGSVSEALTTLTAQSLPE